MRYFGQLSLLAGALFLVAAFLNTAWRAARRRDPHRLDVALWFLGLGAPLAASGSLPLRLTFNLLLPFLLLRLARHFREIPRVLTLFSWALALVAGALRLTLGGSGARTWIGLSYAYIAFAMFGTAAVMMSEGLRSAGIKSKRLTMLGIALCFFGMGWVPPAWALLVPLHQPSPSLEGGGETLQGLALIGFFFALATPRRLLNRWRRYEQATSLERTMSRDPEERGARAADDLLSATVRALGGAATVVALREGGTGALTVAAATDSAAVGCTLTLDGGLLTAVMQTGEPFMDAPIACEPSLSPLVLPHGVRVLIAPIRTEATSRGAVISVLRRGALFPEDDLLTMTQLGRNAATALDHAGLIADRREQDRRAADRRLRVVEERMDLTLDSITDYAMLVLEADGQVAAWHHGAAEIFGYSREQVASTPAHVLYDVPAGELASRLDEANTQGRVEWEGGCHRADGSTFVGLTTIRPLVSDAGRAPGYVAVTRDVTERRHLEDQLRHSQKMEAIGQLAGGVAHDFNNLLTAILGYADWLDHGLRDDPRRGQVTAIQKAAERAADLTRQLLAFSRREMVQPIMISVSQLVNDLIPMLRRIIGDHIEIIDATSPTAWVFGDRSQVEQIILNLAVNARDAMSVGGRLTFRTSDVTLDVLRQEAGLAPGRYVQLEVSDTGIGMDEATRRRMFEPFFTTKDVGRGTGLGLSTVYGIVQQMHGAIDVDSVVDHGTTFRLCFPHASDAPVSTPEIAAPYLAEGTETLLLVEDDDAVRTYLSSVLESHGYRVIAAEHANSALALTDSSAERIDLVISDVAMPGSTGPELMERLGHKRPGLPALFISGHPATGTTPAAVSIAEDALLQKPFSSVDLLTKVRKILSAA